MPLKKPVGAERRMDLASFFCMIGRHGPAVALAVVAVVTVLAGFYIYRTVKGRRRKAACDDGAASPAEEDRDASVTREGSLRSEESTDVKKVMEDVGNLRRRPAAAAEERRPTSPPQIQTHENKLAAVFRAAQVEEKEEEEEVHQVWFKESSVHQEEQEKLLKDQERDGGEASRAPGREERRRETDGDCQGAPEMISNDPKGAPASLSCSSPDQPAELQVLSAGAGSCEEPQPEEETQRNGPVCNEEDEEEDLSRHCTVSSDEEHRGASMSAPAAAGSAPPTATTSQPPNADQTSERVDHNPESSIQAEETSRLATPGELRSAPDGASPRVCDLQLSSGREKEEEEEEDDDGAASSAGVGPESGISSLAVSPDVEADGNLFPVSGGAPQTEAASSGSGSSGVSDQLTEVTVSSLQSCTQMFQSESIRWTHQQPPAANEDTFGHEIEDGYHSYYDRFAAQIAVSISEHVRTSVTSVQVVETNEKISISVKKKEEDLETEADHERTEISIMEATMDTNEWITDGNAPLLPWMAPPPLGHPKTHRGPSDECSASGVPPSTAVPQTGTLSADESVEHSKKVVAVQPMPQNVDVTFRVQYHTQWPHQTVAVTGDLPELGSWKGFIPLEKVEEGQWSAVVSLPTESHVEWKFVLLEKGQVCRWEECRNRLLDTGLGDDVLVHTWWGLA